MKIKVNNELEIEGDIAFGLVDRLCLEWRPNCHVSLIISGCIDSEQKLKMQSLYGSKILIWYGGKNEKKLVFNGYLVKVVQECIGKADWMKIEAQSATCLLDRHLYKRSFQTVEKTYEEIIWKIMADENGQAICLVGKNDQIKKPLIQYMETVWEFSKRIASHFGECVVADITADSAALWFGMREGEDISPFLEVGYSVNVRRVPGEKPEITYWAKSRKFYKLGDKTTFGGKELIICGVTAKYEFGELIFEYTLRDRVKTSKAYNRAFGGLGLRGTVEEVQGEQIKIALDIDKGNSNDYYFYNWYPETGDTLYAVPEKGTKVVLNLASHNEQDAFALHCIPDSMDRNIYRNRHIYTINNNMVSLDGKGICVLKNWKDRLVFGEGTILLFSRGKFDFSAKKNVRIDVRRIRVVSPIEINICQG